MSKKIIEVDNVSFCYSKGEGVVKNISFSLDERTTTLIIGPNGSGKTTLLKILTGLLKPNKGSAKIYGKEPKDVRDIYGYVPQKLYFDETFPITVLEFLKLSLKALQASSKEEIYETLESVGASGVAQMKIGQLSGGQLQRVLIARSLLGQPQILFLDEPVSGIDVGGEESFYDLMKKIQTERNITVVMISHELHVVHNIADKVVCINKEMLCSGAPEKALAPDVIGKLYTLFA